MKIFWKYCGRISQLGFFILSFHSPPHMCPLSPFFYLFFSSRTFKQHHLLFSSKKRERRRQRERRKTRGSMFTMPSEIEVHHALPRPPSHRCSSSSPPSSWIRSACSIFFHICLFWFNFILRIGFCFVFFAWINYFSHEQVSLFSLFSFFFLLFF